MTSTSPRRVTIDVRLVHVAPQHGTSVRRPWLDAGCQPPLYARRNRPYRSRALGRRSRVTVAAMANEMRQIASGLQFPEGPIAMNDGSVVLVSRSRAGTSPGCRPTARSPASPTTGGGPNGAAVGPDGKVYVCNNGGFEWHEVDGMTVPGAAAGRLHRRPHPARRPRHRRRSRTSTPSATASAARPERHRVRRPGRLLLHRPRQVPRP